MNSVSKAISLACTRHVLPKSTFSCVRCFACESRESESEYLHLINTKVPVTYDMKFHGSLGGPEHTIPVFRILRPDGSGLVDGAHSNRPTNELMLNMYKTMVTTQVMDTIFYDSQRQGRFGFYMTCTGEEASIVGSAAALHLDDVVRPRSAVGSTAIDKPTRIQMPASLPKQSIAEHTSTEKLVGNTDAFQHTKRATRDPSKGRQMPIHYGSAELNMVTVSSVVATQAPHAVGAAYALKLRNEKRITATYFGDGGTSEGDSHAAFLFATTLECPVVFLCRNNGFAISTPSFQNFVGAGVSERASAYGIRTIRVDGGDILAVYTAVQEARKIALDGNCPCLVELMTYRVGHHSTSDDSSRYRDTKEMAIWRSQDPVDRLRIYLEKQGLWDKDKEATLRSEKRAECTDAMRTAGAMGKHPATEIFTDVYEDMPDHLKEQREDMLTTLRRFPELSPPGLPAPEDQSDNTKQ